MPSAWLLVHGQELFIGLLAGAMGLGALAWFPWRRACARRAVRRHGRLQARPVDPGRFSQGAQVAVQGRLEPWGPECARFEDGSPAAVASIEVAHLPRETVRAGGLAVNVGGTVVELCGQVDLVVGSAEIWKLSPLGRLPRAIAERAAVAGLEVGSVPHRRAVLRSLATGDLVRAAGRLEVAAADRGPGDYRQAARRFRMVEDEPGLPVAIAAVAAPRLNGCRLAAFRFGLTLALLAGALGALVGELAFRSDDPAWIAVAAGTPFRRRSAIERLADRVRDIRVPSAGGAREAFTLGRVPRYCETAAQSLLSAGDPPAAARLGERCGTDLGWSIAARSWTALGDLERASAAAARDGSVLEPHARVRMHVLAGDMRRAARTAERLRDRLPACLPEALAARTGDRSALARLAAAARPDQSTHACTLLYADLLDGWDRIDFLESRASTQLRGGARHPSLTERIAALLWVETDPAHPPSVDPAHLPGPVEPGDRVLPETNPESLLFELETELHGVPALEHSVLDVLDRQQPLPDERSIVLHARLAASRAAFESIAGDDDEARAWAARAVRDYEAVLARRSPTWGSVAAALEEARGLQAAVVLRAGRVGAAQRALERVSRTAWFAPPLRIAAAEGRPPPFEARCNQEGAPSAHCSGVRAVHRWQELWWSVEGTTTSPTSRQLVVAAGLARLLSERSRLEGAPAVGRWLVRRAKRLRAALDDRDRAVLLAVLDDPALDWIERSARSLTERARSLAGSATASTQLGWLTHRDRQTLSVWLTAGRCATFVIDAVPWSLRPAISIEEPVERRAWHGASAYAAPALRVCPTRTGEHRVNVTAGMESGVFALSWFEQ